MKDTNRETKNPFVPFLTGMVLAVVLGLMVASSTPAFALGGGGGGGGSAPAPKINKVDDPVAKLGDEVAEVKKPVVDPGDEILDDKTPVGELKTKEPEEKTLAIKDPDEDKAANKPEVVEATVGFATLTSSMAEGGGRLRLEVRSGVLSQPITLDVVVGGTAEQGTDYTISSTSLTIPAGTASAFLTVTGIDDAIYETSETITLVLKGHLPASMKFGTDTHTVTIVDDEIEVIEATVGFERGTTQMDEGGNASLRVALSRPFPQPVTVRLSMEGDADAFEFSPGTVAFRPGETSKVVDLGAVEDADSADERVTIYLGGNFPDGIRYGEIHGHIVTIIDNDVSGTVGFAAGNDTATSEGDTVRLTVASSVAPGAGSSVSFDWSVFPADEVVRAGGRVTITGPARTGTFEINIADDDVAETEERITITLSDGNPHDFFTLDGSATHTITIPANDQIAEVVEATVDFAVPFSQVVKGATGNLQVVLSNPLSQALTLTLSEGNSEDGEDKIINFSSDVLTFQPGETSKVVSFTIRDTENRYESAIVFLEGDLPEGVTLGAHNFHFITILDTGNRPTGGVDEKPGGENPQVAVKPDDETGTDAEDKTVDKPDERTVDFPESGSEVVEATVGFGRPNRRAFINHPRSNNFSSVWRGSELGWSQDDNSMPVTIVLSNPLPQPLELSLNAGEADARLQDGEGTIDVYYPSHLTFAPGETRKVLWFDLDIVDGAWDASIEPVRFTLYGDLPNGVEFGTRSLALHFELVFTTDDGQDGIDETAAVEDIEVSHYDEGEISIINEEHVHEIRALHYDADNKDTEISIENRGVVDNNIVGRIFNAQNSGGISIKNTIQGTVGSDVIGKHHGDGKVSIENHGTIGHDIRAVQFGNGGIEITNYGNVRSSIEATNHGSGAVSIENHGSVWSEIRILHRGSGDISIENHEATGMTVDHYGAGDILIKNYGDDEGTSVWHHGDNGIIRFDGNLFDAWFASKTIRFGNVNFRNYYEENYRGEEVIVDFAVALRGGYEASSDTQLNFHISPDINYGNAVPGSIRKLWINGDVTGQSRVSLIVDDVSFITESTNFPALIVVEGDHDVKADSFVGEQTVGAFNYVLEYGTYEEEVAFHLAASGIYEHHAWSFINQGLSDTAVKISQIPDENIKNIETPPTTNPDKQTKKLGLWGEQNGSHTTIGLDALAVRWMGGNMLVGTSMSKNSSISNNIDVESQITALTANWERKGFYVGGQTRYARFTSDVSTNRLSVVQDNEGTGVNASVDLGYRFAFPFGGMDFQVAPQARLVWSRVNFDDFVGPHGELVSLEDGDLVTGHLGLSWDGEWQDDGGFGRIYGGINLRGALDGQTSVNVSGVSVANERKGLSVDGRLGLSYEWDEGYAVYGEVSALRDDAEEIRADLGVSIDF